MCDETLIIQIRGYRRTVWSEEKDYAFLYSSTRRRPFYFARSRKWAALMGDPLAVGALLQLGGGSPQNLL